MKVIRHRTRPRPPHNLTQPLLRQHRASLSPSPTQPHLRRPIANQWMLLKRRMLKIKITRVMDRGFQLNAQKMGRMRLRGHQHLWSNQARVSRSSQRVVRLKMVRTLQSRHRITPMTKKIWMPKVMMNQLYKQLCSANSESPTFSLRRNSKSCSQAAS